MTDTLNSPAPTQEPRAPERDNTNRILLAVIAAVAITALAMLVILGPVGNDGHTGMMTNDRMAGSAVDHAHMMDGSMMTGSMMNRHGPASATVPGAREVTVSASSFRFAPEEIRIRTGEDVTIVLAATDTPHDFTIDELDVHVAAAPGQAGRGGLHAPSFPGRYTAYCSVPGHREAGMTATVVVDTA